MAFPIEWGFSIFLKIDGYYKSPYLNQYILEYTFWVY